MDAVNLKEARKHLGHLVDAVERGETIVLTRRGKRVARLVPVKRKAPKGLPDLSAFRDSIRVRGRSLTDDLLTLRKKERY